MVDKYKKVEEVIAARSKYTNTRKTTGYRGVVIDTRGNNARYQSKFAVRAGKKRIDISLGSYDTAEEAYIARIKFIDSLK